MHNSFCHKIVFHETVALITFNFMNIHMYIVLSVGERNVLNMKLIQNIIYHKKIGAGECVVTHTNCTFSRSPLIVTMQGHQKLQEPLISNSFVRKAKSFDRKITKYNVLLLLRKCASSEISLILRTPANRISNVSIKKPR